MFNKNKCIIKILVIPWNSTCLPLRFHIPEIQTRRAIQCPHRAAHHTIPFRASRWADQKDRAHDPRHRCHAAAAGHSLQSDSPKFQWSLVPLWSIMYRLRSLHVVPCRYTTWYLDQHQWQVTENQCGQQLFVNQSRKRGLRYQYGSDTHSWRLSPILKVWLLLYLALLLYALLGFPRANNRLRIVGNGVACVACLLGLQATVAPSNLPCCLKAARIIHFGTL